MLIAYAGTNTRHALKGVMQRLPNGVSIKVPRAGGRHTCLPLRNKGSYLGAVISYHNFELLTWQHRKQAGWSAFARLRAWLRSRQLSRANRFYLWKTCVYTVLTYGLMSTGVNIRVLMEFQGTIFQMVRTILNDHSYITHRSHQSAFQFHHIDQPLEMLQALAMGLLTRIQRRDIHMLPHDFLHQLDWQPLHDVLQLIRSLITAAPEVPISVNPEDPVRTQAGQQCPHCHFMTDSIPNMRRHLTTQHGEPRYRTESISPLAMTVNGKPQCNNCLFVFSTWKSFLVHVPRACCQVRRSMTEPPQPDVQMSPTPAVDQVHRHYQVAAQQFWPELERCIQTDDWTGLKRLEPCLEHLTHHCAICGTWCNRFQELHSHYRLYHDAQLKGGVAKGAQLTQVLQLSSPCELCHKAYSRVHSCPVALQVAILRLQMQEPDVRQQTELTCEICVQQFDDHSQMYQHMAREHGQTLSDWIPSRDSVQGSNQCRHCTLQFDSRSGLRRHITEGRCEAFDPLASLNPQDTTSQWSTWLRSGDFSPTGLTAHQRLQLTTTCQFCAVKYMRTGDLVAHLLQSHGPLWNDSQQMLRYLLQVVMASRGCICNPQAHEVGLAHICTPLRQVAMMMVSNDVPILVPTQFQATSLATQLSYLHDDALAQRVTDILLARMFDRLWTDPLILQTLRSRCLTCGGHYQPAELLRHLLTVHPQTCAWATQIAFQLHDLLQRFQQQDYRCNLCQQVFNLPAVSSETEHMRSQVQQSHFVSSCPVVLQIAILLQPINGRLDGPQRSSFDGGSGGIGSPVAGHTETARRRRRRAATQTAQSQGQRRPKLRRTQRDDHAPVEVDGPTDPQPRAEPPARATAGLLRFVLPKQARGNCPTPDGDGIQVARGVASAEGQHPMAQSQNVPPEGGHHGAAPQSPTAGQQQAGRTAVGGGCEQGHHPTGWRMELPEVGTGVQTAGPSSSPSSGHAPDASESSAPGGPSAGQCTRGQISESQEQQPGRHPMDPPDQPQRERGLGSPCGPLPQHSVVVAWNVGQTAFPIPLETGHAPSTNLGQGTGTAGEEPRPWERSNDILDETARECLRSRVLGLAMDNPGNNCYANSAYVSMIWATLSRTAFHFRDWGARSAILQQTLQHTDGTLFSLDHEDWFQHLMEGWNEEGEQADSAEFVHMLSSWTAMPAISNCWERRVQTGQNLVRHDAGDKYMPLTLQIDPQLVEQNEISLSTLLRPWHTELGMVAGLTDPEELLLLHIDRLVQAPSGRLSKCQAAINFGWEVQVPVLTAQDCTCMWTSFTVIACISHLGTAQNGHYQTILRTFPEVSDIANPSMWMMCDDGRTPYRILTVPALFAQGITCLWLCRSDRVEVHKLSPATDSAPSHEADLLTLLATQPDPEP